ncbi:uncharacterized protein A4U43_C03F12230 [Asparagus officinalis]|uniref:Uncharacterized protein n=1 Tax=Asparagus officinalis TaxID=4686 RepID=A0A5P1F9D0_ASPOF|nr:uncharacterized protein A4U43_C03F12230 [Asparagus officinalis]
MIGMGVFSRFSVYSPQTSTAGEDEFDVRDRASLLGAIDGDRDTEQSLDGDFKPVDHPLEPEKDEPITCPAPDCFLLKKDEVFWKNGINPLSIKEGQALEQPSRRVESKKQGSLRRDHLKSVSFRKPRNVFRIFQECSRQPSSPSSQSSPPPPRRRPAEAHAMSSTETRSSQRPRLVGARGRRAARRVGGSGQGEGERGGGGGRGWKRPPPEETKEGEARGVDVERQALDDGRSRRREGRRKMQ